MKNAKTGSPGMAGNGEDSVKTHTRDGVTSEESFSTWHSGNGGILRHRSLMEPLHRCLFKPRCGRPAATEGGDWISISVGEFDRGAIDEAVGAAKLHIGGDDK